jgi:hypothetical protein
MSLFDSDFSSEDFDNQINNLDEEIQKCKESIEGSGIYGCSDTMEELVQLCLEYDKIEDGILA